MMIQQQPMISLKRSWPHINQVTCALRFFYAVTLGRKEAIERIISAREPIKQPLVLSAEEVARFLEAVPALRDRVALVTAYAAGLRVGEVSRLKPSSIDSKRMLILISATIRVFSTCERFRRPVGHSITSSRPANPLLGTPKWTPILPSRSMQTPPSKAETSSHDHMRSGRRGSGERLRSYRYQTARLFGLPNNSTEKKRSRPDVIWIRPRRRESPLPACRRCGARS
jgi:hypothetical protein